MNFSLPSLCMLLVLISVEGCQKSPGPKEETIVQDVLSGKLVADAAGRVLLPVNLSDTTCDGSVYVTKDADGTTYVFFADWRGKGANCSGLLYCSRGVTNGTKTFSVLVGTSIQDLPPERFTLRVQVDVEAKVSQKWYRVRFGLD